MSGTAARDAKWSLDLQLLNHKDRSDRADLVLFHLSLPIEFLELLFRSSAKRLNEGERSQDIQKWSHLGNDNTRYVKHQIDLGTIQPSDYLFTAVLLRAVHIVDDSHVVSKFGRLFYLSALDSVFGSRAERIGTYQDRLAFRQ